MGKLTSEGKCLYCSETFKSGGISHHLNSHLQKKEREQKDAGSAYHLRVGLDVFFLNLLMDENATLADLDWFLRAIWLECCGHMSSFSKKGVEYDNEWGDFDSEIGEPKGQKAKEVFRKGDSINYEYDFGSTTHLEINVLEVFNVKTDKPIDLLSRNEPIAFPCHKCRKKTAVEICSVHVYDGACMFCEDCAEKHEKECPDFEDYAAMPVVNSPRMGICAYEGGTIDVERDAL